jgi:hypothetical protein
VLEAGEGRVVRGDGGRGGRRSGSAEELVVLSKEELIVIRNKGINHVLWGGRRAGAGVVVIIVFGDEV